MSGPNPIIVALDVDSAEEARALVRRIGPAVGFYKVGLELYCAAGMIGAGGGPHGTQRVTGL